MPCLELEGAEVARWVVEQLVEAGVDRAVAKVAEAEVAEEVAAEVLLAD